MENFILGLTNFIKNIISFFFKEKLELYKNRGTEKGKIASRLRKVLELMNDGRTHDKYHIAKLASILGLEKAGELESYFLGKEEPTFEFLDMFSETFAVNPSWLKFGDERPFFSSEIYCHSALDYYDHIIDLKPVKIYFVKCDSQIGEAIIVLKFEEWKFIVINDSWHISSHVGGTGRRQLYELYQLIVKLMDLQDIRCGGRIISYNLLLKLMNGEIFPGSVLSQYGRENDWWYCLTDIHHKSYVADNYINEFGQEFLKAHEIIKEEIKRSNK